MSGLFVFAPGDPPAPSVTWRASRLFMATPSINPAPCWLTGEAPAGDASALDLEGGHPHPHNTAGHFPLLPMGASRSYPVCCPHSTAPCDSLSACDGSFRHLRLGGLACSAHNRLF